MTRFPTLLFAGLILLLSVAASAAITEQQLKARITESTKDFEDLTMVGTAVYKDKKALSKVEPAYARLYDFKTANVLFKPPDKLRMESKLGMVRVEYIINGSKKILRAPKLKVNKIDDFTGDPAKLQDALDLGLITPGLWRNRRIEVLDDPEADGNGEIKLRLYWSKGDMIYLAWIDADNLWLKRFEKRDPQNNLQVRMIYSNPQKVGGVIWIPAKAEMFTGDGEKAGATQFTDMKVNTGLSDSLFK